MLFSVAQAAPITDFTLISDFQERIHGGETLAAEYSFHSSEGLTVYLQLKINSTEPFTGNLSEFTGGYMMLNGENLICDSSVSGKNVNMECPANLSVGSHNVSIGIGLAVNIKPSTFSFEFNIKPYANYSSESHTNIQNQTVNIETINNALNETQTALIVVDGKQVNITLEPNSTYQYAEMPEDDITILPSSSGVEIKPEGTSYTSATKELRIQAEGEGEKTIYIFSSHGRPEKIYFDDAVVTDWSYSDGMITLTVTMGSPHQIIIDWERPIVTVYRGGGTSYVYRNVTQNITKEVVKEVPAKPVCGNGICESGEAETCPGDCKAAQVCVPDVKLCAGDDLMQCSSDGSEWNTIETCEYGCSDNECNEKPEVSGPLTGFITGAETPLIFGVLIAIAVVIGGLFYRARKSKVSK